MNIRQRILDQLEQIQRDHDVRILYACESGSRAWGFESSDSDYDVRFIYVHRRDWYLAIDTDAKRDVIELPIDDELDINGWELRKALNLLRKSNPPLLEWIGSPDSYLERPGVLSRLRLLRDTYCSPKACAHHYLHMARGNFREFLKGPEVRLKKYLYVLRPLLGVQWIEAGLGVVPTEFVVLVERLTEGALRQAIDDLLVQKRRGFESDRGPAIPEINAFIQSELDRLENSELAVPVAKAPAEPLSRFFRDQLTRAWEEDPEPATTEEPWYGVRCHFSHGPSPDDAETTRYEERILLIRAGSFDEAFALAEKDAEEYARQLGAEYLGHAQAYHPSEPSIDEGAEVYSLMRDSPYEPAEYLDRFFDTGTERTS